MPLWGKWLSNAVIWLNTPFIEVMVAGRNRTTLFLPFLFRHMAYPSVIIIHRSILKVNLNMPLQSHLPVPVSLGPWHPLIPTDSLGKQAMCDAVPCWHRAREWQYQTLLYCTYAQTNLSATQTNPPVHYTNQTLFAIFSVLFKIMPLTWFHYHFQDHIHSVVHRYNRSSKSINMIRRVNIVWNCHGKHNLKETSYIYLTNLRQRFT